MIIKQKEYLDKVRACFMGKNIGGTLGTPVEGKRGVFNIEFYTHDTSKGALPNDDLDLQLVWLVAAERYGNKVNSQILADYWAARIFAHWNEYGQGKVNVKNGLVPPVSGAYHNPMKDSNGAWIRSEIWACLCPGHPELAVQYAFEDSSVDHADEGIYAEVFTAALESAAFVEKDFEKLVDIALSYLPADCAIAGVVRLVQKCKKDGLTWRQARKEVLTQYPDGFVHHVLPCEPEDEVPVGKKGFDAPANIGIVMIGWLYGEGDFAKTLCTAANCGEDGDCTCATLGALWGILHGMDGIPQKWIEPIGEEIKVGCVDMTHEGTLIPKTISALTKRVANLMPAFMTHNVDITAEDGFEISALEGDKLFDSYELPKDLYVTTHNFKELCEIRNPMSCKVDSPFLTTYLVYNNGIEISEGVETSFKLIFKPNFRQGWADVKINMPADWEVKPGHKAMLSYGMYYDDYTEHEIRFTPHNLTEGMYEFGIEIRVGEVRIPRFVPVTLIVK